MSHGLQSILFAIIILLLAEDFQHLLKADHALDGQTLSEQIADFEDSEEDAENKTQKSEENESEKRDKDENNYLPPAYLLKAGRLLANTKSSLVLAPISEMAHELESPPPEV